MKIDPWFLVFGVHDLHDSINLINKMPILAFTRDAVADSFISTVCFADL